MTRTMRSHSILSILILILSAAVSIQAATPPPGFKALFNGKDLDGWRGGDTLDHRKYLAMPEEKRVEQDKKWTDDMSAHWRAENDEFVNDGKGKYATTTKDYGDFELL